MDRLKERIREAEDRVLYLKQKVANQDEYLMYLYRLRAKCAHVWKNDGYGEYCAVCGEVG